MVIGLTGKSCSGKDVAASYFAAKGLAVVDVDKLGHEALVANHDLLVETFGKGIEKADGTIDRKALGAIVFSDASQLARLDGISHPWMRSQVIDFIGRHEVSIINCALLERMRLVELCDEVLFFLSPLEQRIERAMGRDGTTREAFLRREASQQDIGQEIFSSGRRIITIMNDSTKAHLSRQLDFYYDTLVGRGYVHG